MDTPTRKFKSWFERTRSHRLTTTFALLATLSAGILVGSVITGGVSGKEQAPDSSDAKPLTIPAAKTLSNGFSQIAKQVGPAVVNINTESLPKQLDNRRGRRGPQRGTPGDDDDQQNDMQDFFNRFFGNPGGGDDGDGMMGAERRALGSGFIVDPRGYIITNNHVVDKADKIYVRLSTDPNNGPDSEGRPAKIIGTDKDTDIAVIKIESDKPLPTIKLGNSDGAQVGDWVLAIGSPFGLSQTVSAGIVSAKNRSIDEPSPSGISQSQFQRFIQTDAAINPGNSGGPLVNMDGEVIGMNTAIYTQSMGSQGVGFAMPSNIIANVYNMLIGPEHKVVRGSIGISFQSSTSSAVGRIYGFKNGIIVSTVTPNGGAAKAGIKPGDVIVSIDGRQIKDGDDLVNDISGRKVGSTVKLGYLRDGKQGTADVTIGDRAKTYADLMGDNGDDDNSPQESDAGQTKLGITVAAIPASVAQKTGISRGVIVMSVRPGSFADEIGLGKGAIITEINKKAVTDEASYRSIVSGLKSKDDVVFVIHSPLRKDSGNSYVGGTLP
ncbi:trypsin-like peptidase domain-containing protein [Edaphobacter sp. 12200R-103]|jgi:serine protease Do|uniref:trypsin-like peptidase domain-containing protein n=1 Tax=Edaphobacter sp. 12200R-103 TaxID=2703788 RepID=UPI00138D1191|nr:trypsin-like peptidase domain-containing protein [Edaphobacter sp. 12200R-103]QHS51138.1 PDZ domain-containing protein [Edaphobacter sp. 12200R-103]